MIKVDGYCWCLFFGLKLNDYILGGIATIKLLLSRLLSGLTCTFSDSIQHCSIIITKQKHLPVSVLLQYYNSNQVNLNPGLMAPQAASYHVFQTLLLQPLDRDAHSL